MLRNNYASQLEAEYKMQAAKYIEKLIFNINLTQAASWQAAS